MAMRRATSYRKPRFGGEGYTNIQREAIASGHNFSGHARCAPTWPRNHSPGGGAGKKEPRPAWFDRGAAGRNPLGGSQRLATLRTQFAEPKGLPAWALAWGSSAHWPSTMKRYW